MKKIIIGLFTTLALCAAAVTFAETPPGSGYFVSTNTGKAYSKTMVMPATNITILNYADESIYVVVPNSPINYEIASGNARTISHHSYYGATRIILQYWNHVTFYDQYHCRRSIITVDGQFGFYRIKPDGTYC